MLTLRDKKKDTDSRDIEVIVPVEKKISEASGYIVSASQAEKEYFDKIKNVGNIFTKDMSKEEMAAIKQLHRIDKKTDRKGRRADVYQDISQEKLIFQSGGFIQISVKFELQILQLIKRSINSFGKNWFPKI